MCYCCTSNCMAEGQIWTKCFACGLPTCRQCSLVIKCYYRWRNKRICLDCITEHCVGAIIGSFDPATGQQLAGFSGAGAALVDAVVTERAEHREVRQI